MNKLLLGEAAHHLASCCVLEEAAGSVCCFICANGAHLATQLAPLMK